jgi:hypothetical protein
MVDLAPVLSLDALARAFHEAGIKHGTTPDEVEAVLERRPNSPGAAKLRAVLFGDAPVLLSRLERRFLRLLRDHGLPLPETNRRVDGRFVDCRWPQYRLTVELDGYGDVAQPRELLAELGAVLPRCRISTPIQDSG